MAIKLSVAIMAHPAREAAVTRLVERLGGGVPVVWDEKRCRIDTGIRSLLAHDPGSTHHLVLQDDAVVPNDLIAGVMRLLEHPGTRRDVPFCLYAGNVGKFVYKFEQAFRKRTYSWMTMDGLNWGVAVILPTLDIEPLVNFMLTRGEPNYDLRMSRYYESRRVKVWYPVPSLVDHDAGPSLICGHGDNRKAWRFIGEHNSAMNFDMDKGRIHLPLARRYIPCPQTSP